MKIRFGLNLDGQRGWHVRDSLGEITVGASGMLGILEPQLGLILNSVPQSQRVVQYLDCLNQYNNSKRFFHESLKVDALGTAATLLNWRDQWYLHGWNGKISDSLSSRLSDMAEVESIARGAVSPSEGERLQFVLEAMQHRKPAITNVSLVSPLNDFPQRWQAVLGLLPCEQALVNKPAPNKSFLSEMQSRIREAQSGREFKKEDRLRYKADGSLAVYRAETRLLASRWLAEHIGRGVEDGALVTSDAGALLDDIMSAAGKSRHGKGESSAYRPSLQILPMALALLWDPLDFYVLISFLSHPVSPVSAYARRQLAGKLASSPGIGGSDWEKVLSKIDEHYGEKAGAVREGINTWVDHPRFSPSAGVPVDEVLSRSKKLADYFRVRLNDDDLAERASWNAGYSQTVAFIRSLEQMIQSGVSVLFPPQLKKLLDQASSRGSSNPKLVAEVGAVATVDDPSALIESFDQVIWWQPVLPTMPKGYPWSDSERKVLADSGVDLPALSSVLERMAADWLKPILAAKHKLLIVLPPKDAETHPAWQMISALVEGVTETPIENILHGTKLDGIKPIEVPHTPLPLAKRWWKLPAEVSIPKRKKESFSSLDSYLFNPYQWLLKYPARLSSSNILSISDSFLLNGKLAHNLIEQFFSLKNPLKMSDVEVKKWFEDAFKEEIKNSGAVLLMSGRGSDYEGLRYSLRRALMTLLSQLKAANVEDAQSEMDLLGHYIGGELQGSADLVLTNSSGKKAILDLKWAGGKKYPGKLAENAHLQLGIYAEILRQQTGQWPDVAYFILVEGKLFAQHTDYFPSGTRVNKKTEESTAHLWERFKQSYTWRNDLLTKGWVEVGIKGIVQTEDLEHPEDGLKPEYLKPEYNEYLNLAGWRQS